MNYFIRVLLGLDQFGNTLIGGEPDETISARAGRLKSKFGWKQLACGLDYLQSKHVEEAIEHELDGSQQSVAYKELYDAYQLEQKAKEVARKAAEVAAQTQQVVAKAADAVNIAKTEPNETNS